MSSDVFLSFCFAYGPNYSHFFRFCGHQNEMMESISDQTVCQHGKFVLCRIRSYATWSEIEQKPNNRGFNSPTTTKVWLLYLWFPLAVVTLQLQKGFSCRPSAKCCFYSQKSLHYSRRTINTNISNKWENIRFLKLCLDITASTLSSIRYFRLDSMSLSLNPIERNNFVCKCLSGRNIFSYLQSTNWKD